MNASTMAEFHVGDLVEELGSDVRGYIEGLGEHEGELHVRLRDGSEVVCLAENLRQVSTGKQ